MARPLLEALKTQAPLVSDGGNGTELQKAGLEPGGCGDQWNLTHPERVLAVHRAYVAAGSQLITTNTFGSNRFVLANYGLESRVVEICRAGARLAREALDGSGWMLGSVGPCGGFLEPLGEIKRADLEASLREQIGALLEAGVDAIILETMSALDELEMGIHIAREMRAPCGIASLAYGRVRDGYKTMMGVTPDEAARLAAAAGADILGANCGTELKPVDFVEMARRYRSVTHLPLCLQPNAGTPELQGTAIVYRVSAEEMGRGLLELSRHAQIVGGCCGVSPKHIRAFRELLQGEQR